MTADEFNRGIIEEFRANRGRVGGPLAGTPILLLHHIGAKSGRERVTPLAYMPEEEGHFVIVASNGGAPTHPSWYHNLKANPVVEIEVGSETSIVRAEELSGARRDARWSRLVAASASLRVFQAGTRRRIPIFLLAPASGCPAHLASASGVIQAEACPPARTVARRRASSSSPSR